MTVNQDMIRMRLEDVPEDKVFWCCNDRILRNLKDLASALKKMNQEVYSYHANDEKNDFSNWVHDVVGDVTLAYQLRKAKSRDTAARRVDERLEWLQTRA